MMAENLETLSPEEMHRIIHALRAHQIEQEKQNKELLLALEAERESGKRFKLMFMNAPMPYQSLNENGNFIEVNQTFLNVLGYKREELIGRNFGEVLHPDWVAHFKENFPRFKAIGEVLGVEFEMMKKDGSTILVSFNGKIQRDDQGHFQRTHCIFQDISERKRAQEALLVKTRTLQSVFESAPYIMMLVNREGRVTDINRPGVRFTGKNKHELLGKLGGEVFGCLNSFDGRGCGKNAVCEFCPVRSRVMQTFETGQPVYEGQGHLDLMADGVSTMLDILVSTTLVTSIEDSQVLVTIADITDRVRAEEALRKSEEKHRIMFETMALGVVYQNADGRIISANPAAERILGLSFNQMFGETSLNTLWKTIREDGSELPGQEHPSMVSLQTGKPVEQFIMGVLNPKRKAVSWISVTSIPLFRPGETMPFQVYTTFEDITEKRRAEQDYRTLFREMFDGFALHEIICNEAGNPVDYRFLAVNPAFEDMTGLKAGDIEGRTVLEVLPETESSWINTYGKVALTGEPISFENYSAEIQKHFKVTAFQPAPNRFACIFSDITEHKQAEADKSRFETRLQQAQKMEAIGSLAGGIAHDLNNILFPISGLSEMLLDDLPPESPVHEGIEQIHKSAQRGGELVKQILAFSRQSNPRKLPIRIQPILKEVLKLARATIPTNIKITSHISTDCGMVAADPTQMHQVMMNLITNAYHAVEENGGMIGVGLKAVNFDKNGSLFDMMPTDGYACITVSDAGTGIDQALIDKIFTPYFTTKAQGKGTGLGLSVVHGIVKEHGGDIRVYSEVGKGTTFQVYFPLLKAGEDEKDAPVTRNYPTGCESILLVDDEEPIVRMERKILERLGYHVTARTSSTDALYAFRADPSGFDLVISDRGMPTLTGDQLAETLISIRPRISIILCTGFCNEKDEQRARAMGIKGFLMKPIATEELAAMVRSVLDDVSGSDPVPPDAVTLTGNSKELKPYD